MRDIHWIVDHSVIERGYTTGHPTIQEAITRAGHILHEFRYVPFTENQIIGFDANGDESIMPDIEVFDPVIVYGSVQFSHKVLQTGVSCFHEPLVIAPRTVQVFSIFAAHHCGNLLNDDYVILPLAEIRRRNYLLPNFVKPLEGMKTFPGGIYTNANDIRDAAMGVPAIEVEAMLCVISSPKTIHSEYRYFIVDGQVVTGSCYRYGGVLDVRSDTHPIADELALEVATHAWQPARAYVVDIALEKALTEPEVLRPSIIELNAFSTSGLYACDTVKIVEAIGKAYGA